MVAGFVGNGTGKCHLDGFTWSMASNQVEFSGKIREERTHGTYTVIATDLENTTCVSEPTSVTVGNQSVLSVVIIHEDAPLSNRDLKNPNGQLSAMVDGYKFGWYRQ